MTHEQILIEEHPPGPIRRVLAVMCLVAFTAGIPWLQWRYVGTPWPDHAPDLDIIWFYARSGVLPQEFVLKTAAIIVWICWAGFTMALVLDLIDAVRILHTTGRVAPAGWLQTLAATLIGATIATTHTATAHAATRPATVEAPRQPQPGPDPPAAEPASPPSDEATAADQAGQVHVETATFGFDSDTLTPHQAEQLTTAITEIQSLIDTTRPIIVEGHTDRLGPASYNRDLSSRRARAAAQLLHDLLPDADIRVIPRGETQPRLPETRTNGADDPIARATNRRAEVHLPIRIPSQQEPTGTTTDPRDPVSPKPVARDDDEQASNASLAILGSVGGLLAAGLITALAIKRQRQQRRRRPGHRIRLPQPPSPVEEDLRGAADPVTPDLLDQALRHLAHSAETLPHLVGSRVGAQDLDLVIAGPPQEPVPPFTKTGNATWRLSGQLPAENIGAVSAPYPLLVTLGTAPSGAHVLANLAEIGSIGLDGTPEHVEEILTALALELATSPWADHAVITCIGFGIDLEDLGPTRGVLHMEPTTAAYLHDRSEPAPADSPGTANVVLAAVPFSETEAAELTRQVTADVGPAAPDAVVVASRGNTLPTAWTLNATPQAEVELAELGMAVLQRMSAAETKQIIEVFHVADTPDEPAPPDAAPVPDEPPLLPTHRTEPPSTDQESSRDTHPAVLVLGAVELAGRDLDDVEPGKRRLLVELAAYLKLKPGRSAEEVSRAMGGPRGPWSPATRASNMSRLRAWLGKDPEGRNYVPAQTEGTLYTLNNQVRCDWDDFQRLSQRGLRGGTEGIPDLRSALTLVRGQPFADTGPNRFAWAEPLRQEMISAIVDAAHALACHLIEAGEASEACAVLTHALEVEPISELLYRDLIRAEHQAGHLDGAANAAQRLMISLEQIDAEPEPETRELLDTLLGKH